MYCWLYRWFTPLLLIGVFCYVVVWRVVLTVDFVVLGCHLLGFCFNLFRLIALLEFVIVFVGLCLRFVLKFLWLIVCLCIAFWTLRWFLRATTRLYFRLAFFAFALNWIVGVLIYLLGLFWVGFLFRSGTDCILFCLSFTFLFSFACFLGMGLIGFLELEVVWVWVLWMFVKDCFDD